MRLMPKRSDRVRVRSDIVFVYRAFPLKVRQSFALSPIGGGVTQVGGR